MLLNLEPYYVYLMLSLSLSIYIYSGIRIKSTPRDRKKLLTLSKVDFIHIQGRKPKYY